MNKKEKKVGIASDHAGFALKQFVKQYLEERQEEVVRTMLSSLRPLQ